MIVALRLQLQKPQFETLLPQRPLTIDVRIEPHDLAPPPISQEPARHVVARAELRMAVLPQAAAR